MLCQAVAELCSGDGGDACCRRPAYMVSVTWGRAFVADTWRVKSEMAANARRRAHRVQSSKRGISRA